MKTTHFIAALAAVTLFISCGRSDKSGYAASDYQVSEQKQTTDHEKKQIPVGKYQQPFTDSSGSPVQPAGAASTDWDKKIIKTATVKLEISDFKKYNDYVHNSVKQYGAYIAQEEQDLSDEKSETTISIKVPVAQFESMMNQLPGSDSKILEKKISTEDVTGEVVDTRSRLEAKKQMRQKYLEFLRQSKNMEEVLQVQGEINSIQEQIESATGRVEYLSHQAVYSTINLTFFQPLGGYKPDTGTPSFLTRVTDAFRTGAGWVADLFIGLISIWPLLLVITGVYFGWRRVRTKLPMRQAELNS